MPSGPTSRSATGHPGSSSPSGGPNKDPKSATNLLEEHIRLTGHGGQARMGADMCLSCRRDVENCSQFVVVFPHGNSSFSSSRHSD